MSIDSKYRKALGAAVAALVLAGIATPVLAQRDPAYAAAREAGQVGERVNGYLGIVGEATPDLQRVVDDINNQRRAVYTQRAQAEGATLEQYALTAGCLAISRTVAGEKYQAPDGTWQTRTAAAPVRDPRCP
ncbi:MAG TPA: YdbL family protein [Paracoccaceae bacterium]|nr:YdbL family protein [Paracoccaceae bacterium]